MKLTLLVLALCGCNAASLVEPLPTYVWTCVKTQTFSVTVGGQEAGNTSWCVQYDWTRKADTLVAFPNK